jgi:MerR family regulatory protein
MRPATRSCAFVPPWSEAVSTDRELSIGAFARKSRLSMRALRLYEQLGVLKPVRVDGNNRYRWYAERQLTLARLIWRCARWTCPWPRSPT